MIRVLAKVKFTPFIKVGNKNNLASFLPLNQGIVPDRAGGVNVVLNVIHSVEMCCSKTVVKLVLYLPQIADLKSDVIVMVSDCFAIARHDILYLLQLTKASIKTGFSIQTCGHNEVYLCPLIIENLVLMSPLFFSLRRTLGEARSSRRLRLTLSSGLNRRVLSKD